jgi:hypothetical protein
VNPRNLRNQSTGLGITDEDVHAPDMRHNMHGGATRSSAA